MHDPEHDADLAATRVRQAEDDSPRLPHEHDESSDSQESAAPSQESVGRQAARDLKRGIVDTDRGPPSDQLYSREYRKGKRSVQPEPPASAATRSRPKR